MNARIQAVLDALTVAGFTFTPHSSGRDEYGAFQGFMLTKDGVTKLITIHEEDS